MQCNFVFFSVQFHWFVVFSSTIVMNDSRLMMMPMMNDLMMSNVHSMNVYYSFVVDVVVYDDVLYHLLLFV